MIAPLWPGFPPPPPPADASAEELRRHHRIEIFWRNATALRRERDAYRRKAHVFATLFVLSVCALLFVGFLFAAGVVR